MLPLRLLLLLLLGEVVGGQFQLTHSQQVVAGGDLDVGHRPESLDDPHRRLQPLDRRFEIASFQHAHTDVRLRVVAAQHQLRQVANELASFGQRVVERERLGSGSGGLGLHHVGDLLLDLVEPYLVRLGIRQYMPIVVDADLLGGLRVIGLHDLGGDRSELVLLLGVLGGKGGALLLELVSLLLDLLRHRSQLVAHLNDVHRAETL